MPINERTAKQLTSILSTLSEFAGTKETTSLFTGAEVIDAAYDTGRILVRGKEGYYEPVLSIPGLTYTNGDLVMVLYIKGAEPVAITQAPGSSGDIGGGWPFTGKVLTVDSTDSDADFASLAAAVADAGTVAGDVILLSSESLACNNVTLPDGVHLLGHGPGVTRLVTSTQQVCLNVGDGSVVMNLSVENTYDTNACYAIYMPTSTDTSKFWNVRAYAENNGTVFNAYAFYCGGDSTLTDCEGVTDAGAYGYAFCGIGAGTKKLFNGYYDGSGGSGGTDIYDGTGTTKLYNPVLENDAVDLFFGASGCQGHYQADDGDLVAVGPVATGAFEVVNTSGGAVSAGAVGYIDGSGEFKTTTTAYLDENWCVVIVGGANNANVYVARRGKVIVTLNGNCSAGDYLYTSTTAGQAQPQSYMRPEMFGIALTANAAGAGGTCEALLYCHTKFVTKSDAIYLFGQFASTTSDFRAQITGIAGAVVTYGAPLSGNDNTINPAAANYHAKLRLYNETTADYALIDSTNTGANQITLTAAAPGGWAIGHVITARSQTCVDPGPPPYYYDLDLSSADNTVVPELARAIAVTASYMDSGAAGQQMLAHPWNAYGAAKRIPIRCYNAGTYSDLLQAIPLIQQRWCFQWNASGAATANQVFAIQGWWEAAP